MRLLNNKFALIKGILGGGDAFGGPVSCGIDLIDECHASCINCWTHSPCLENQPLKYELGWREIKHLLFDLKELGVNKIYFAGRGEPFLHRHFLDILEECSLLRLRVSITTSGDFLSHFFLKNLNRYNIESIKISLWSIDATNLKVLCPGRNIDNLINMLDRIKEITKYNSKIISFNCIVAKNNTWEIGNFIEMAYRSGVLNIKFEPVQPFNGNMFMLLSAQEKKYIISRIPEFKRLLRRYKIKNNIDEFVRKLLSDKNNNGKYNPRPPHIIPCFYGWNGLRIMASGDVVFCCECVEHPVGNINKKSFKEIWFSEEYVSFRERAVRYGCIDWAKGEINCEYHKKNEIINRSLFFLRAINSRR